MMAEEALGGRYRLDHVAGHGGMATVFRAHDLVLDRTVAIKLLQRSHDPSGVLKERFRLEARAAAKIAHPNVVTVHDVGENEEGRPYIVMDFVEGETLATMLKDGPLGAEQVAGLGAGIARALAAAHALGIAHRDVKPANVIVDGQGVPHLADFGLARASEDRDLALTAPGTLLGTAHYVAPEQARGGGGSPRADLYALGAVLYHALAGEPPFTGSNAIEVALRRFDEDPPELRERVPGLDAELAAIVMQLLARYPERRPSDAGEVANCLADVEARLRTTRTASDAPTLAGVPLPVPPPPRQRPAAQFGSALMRWRPSAAERRSAAIVGALLGCMLLWLAASTIRAPHPVPVAAHRAAPVRAVPHGPVVPNVLGRGVGHAARILVSAGYRVSVTPMASGALGIVRSQTPHPGRPLARGAEVRIGAHVLVVHR